MGYVPPELDSLLDCHGLQASLAMTGEEEDALRSSGTLDCHGLQASLAMTEGERPSVLKGVCNLAITAFCVVLIVGSLMFALSKDPGKSYFGYRFYHVATASMTPQQGGEKDGFYAGDLIVVKKTPAEELRPGDIITFMPGDDPKVSLTHRIKRIEKGANGADGLFFVTQGDANNAEDLPTPAEKVFGKKVLTIPKAGFVLQTIRSNIAPFAALGAAIVGFFVAISYFFGSPKEFEKGEKKKEKCK